MVVNHASLHELCGEAMTVFVNLLSPGVRRRQSIDGQKKQCSDEEISHQRVALPPHSMWVASPAPLVSTLSSFVRIGMVRGWWGWALGGREVRRQSACNAHHAGNVSGSGRIPLSKLAFVAQISNGGREEL
ncbi:unnamed protein product [Ostreobium quekettii]|uniref:Uncharacterized protein n=1 Tax=Ostreobium quekettii TaxID=121088 RepID=A0A8S1JFC4_9CHLO|nr:unnamed protein product [Ostreobium quekettii]